MVPAGCRRVSRVLVELRGDVAIILPARHQPVHRPLYARHPLPLAAACSWLVLLFTGCSLAAGMIVLLFDLLAVVSMRHITPLLLAGPDYSTFDGAPTGGSHQQFRFDAWRCAQNIAMDFAWLGGLGGDPAVQRAFGWMSCAATPAFKPSLQHSSRLSVPLSVWSHRCSMASNRFTR